MDKQSIFSDNQDITISCASENIIDCGDISQIPKTFRQGIQIVILVINQFSGGTSINVTLQTDDNTNFSSPVNIFTTVSLDVSFLIPGRMFLTPPRLPDGLEQYLRLYYTVSGTMNDGNIDAALVVDLQTLRAESFTFLALMAESTEFILDEDGDYILPF